MKASKEFILTIIITVLLCVFTTGIFVGGVKTGKNKQYSKDYPVQVEMQRQIDSLTMVIHLVDEGQSIITQQRDSLVLELEKVKVQSDQIQKKYDEQIKQVVDYSNPQLEQFFLERYSSD